MESDSTRLSVQGGYQRYASEAPSSKTRASSASKGRERADTMARAEEEDKVSDAELEDDDHFEHLRALSSVNASDVRRGATRRLNFPEPIYKGTINIGCLSYKSRVDQVIEQLGIDQEDFIYWTSRDPIKVEIPD